MLPKFIGVIAAILVFFTPSHAQTDIDKTLGTFSTTIGTIGLGIPENDFFLVKKDLKKNSTDIAGFRDEVVETVGKNGLQSITYYFDAEGERPLYELILEFADATIRAEMAEKMFGPANYPDRPDHWIAGAQEDVVTIAWAFDNKLVIAANLPGSEWHGDDLFNIPAGFELYKHLPSMSEWPEAELARFYDGMVKQIAGGATDFTTFRGAETDGFFTCNAPLAGAEAANVLQGDDKKWLISNTLVSGASAENAILWKLDAEHVISKLETKAIKLSRTKSKAAFGSMVSVWDVVDKSGQPSTMQVGIVHYEWGAEGLWNIDVLVMQH